MYVSMYVRMLVLTYMPRVHMLSRADKDVCMYVSMYVRMLVLTYMPRVLSRAE